MRISLEPGTYSRKKNKWHRILMGQKDKRDIILKESHVAFCLTLKCLMATCNIFYSNHHYSRHRRTQRVRWAALEAKFSQTHLCHCLLCSSCVRSLCCWNTMGGSQHLSGKHSIIVTRGVEWQQTAAQTPQMNQPHICNKRVIFMQVSLRSLKCCGKLFVLLFLKIHFYISCEINVLFLSWDSEVFYTSYDTAMLQSRPLLSSPLSLTCRDNGKPLLVWDCRLSIDEWNNKY